jgi:hypothetical protein
MAQRRASRRTMTCALEPAPARVPAQNHSGKVVDRSQGSIIRITNIMRLRLLSTRGWELCWTPLIEPDERPALWWNVGAHTQPVWILLPSTTRG